MSTLVITGATGNTGSFAARRLVTMREPQSILALVRDKSDTSELASLGIRTHACDYSDPQTYLSAIPEDAAFLGISNIRHCDMMVPPLVEHGLTRFFCVTTTGVFSHYHSYSKLYKEIEAKLTALPVRMTLLRPSMIYGNLRDHNMKRLIRFLDRTPVFPVFGPGTALMQPVFVEDLADGIVAAVERDVTGAYNLAGPEALTYNEILRQVTGALGKTVRLVHIPHGLAARIVNVAENVPGFPVKHEQVMRLLEDKAFDIADAARDLDFRPRPFADGIATEVAEYRSAGR